MNRLQRKCVIASTGFHLSLMLLLVIGPAFAGRDSKTPNVPLINFIPVKTVDDAMSGGGYKDGGPPPQATPAPTPPAPTPPPIAKPTPAPVEPDPPAAVPKPDKPVADTAPKTRPKPNISTVEVDRKNDRNEKAKAEARAQAAVDAQAAADRNKRMAAAFTSAASGIQSGMAGSTAIKLQGPGGGGVPYANWLSAVQSKYQSAWTAPDGLNENTPPVTAEITIAKDGSVVSAHIIRGSGNAAADDSVRATLLRVKYAAPLPETETRDQRTITIDFLNDKARQLLG